MKPQAMNAQPMLPGWVLALILAWMALPATHALGATGGRIPNIVLILADDLGIHDLGCYGRADHATPHIDRMASEGIRLTRAYCAQPICSASRAALLTGKVPARTGITSFLPGRSNHPSQPLLQPTLPPGLNPGHVTLACRLREQGWTCGLVGKWHLGGPGLLPVDHGFDAYQPGRPVTRPDASEGSKGERFVTQAAVGFMEANRHRPFFLMVAHDSPHIPYDATPAERSRFSTAFEPGYAAVIARLDAAVGDVLAALDRLGLRDDTLVLLTSDNGGLHVPELHHPRVTHNGPFRAGKGFLYEGGLRIPLVVRWPGHVPAGRTSDVPVSNVDWVPTLMEAAGLKAPEGLDGTSLLALLQGGRSLPRRRLAWHFPHDTNQGGRPAGALIEGDWKLIEHLADGRLELFNLAFDPGETTNLATRRPRLARRMQRNLASWRNAVGARIPPSHPAFDESARQQLDALFDPSTFQPKHAQPADWERAYAWRRLMDAPPPHPVGP